jgi:quinol monooxygenase YgiN
MVNVAVALLATLAALGGAGLLVSRTLPDRQAHLLAWCGTLFTLGITLGAMTVGFGAGFSPALLRAVELFGSLIAPLTLALGVVELIARTVQARFAARLIALSYVIVAVVIILLDPIIGTFGKSLPKVAGHYSSLPGLVLDGAHIFAVVSLVSCVAVTAVRSNRNDRQAPETMVTLAMVALAGVLVVAAMRSFLPGPLAPLALGGAAALVWFGASRLLPGRPHDDEEPEPYDDMSRYPQQPYDGDQHYNVGQHSSGAQRAVQPSFAPPPPQPMPIPQGPGQYGRITIYTLLDGHAEIFDRLAAEVARAVREGEPGTVVYTCHSVDNAANQRIFYQLFRDASAVEEHTRQPHVQRFAREARPHVGGTNVIELTVNAGKVAPAGGPRPAAQPAAQPVRWPHG